jgi:hypothetical protein
MSNGIGRNYKHVAKSIDQRLIAPTNLAKQPGQAAKIGIPFSRAIRARGRHASNPFSPVIHDLNRYRLNIQNR